MPTHPPELTIPNPHRLCLRAGKGSLPAWFWELVLSGDPWRFDPVYLLGMSIPRLRTETYKRSGLACRSSKVTALGDGTVIVQTLAKS